MYYFSIVDNDLPNEDWDINMRKFFSQKSKQISFPGSTIVMPLLPFHKDNEQSEPNHTQIVDDSRKQDENTEKTKKLFVVVSGKDYSISNKSNFYIY